MTNDPAKEAYFKMVESQPELIICSAIWFDHPEYQDEHRPMNLERGMVVAGMRHHNIRQTISLLMGRKKNQTKYLEFVNSRVAEGFLTNKNRFVDRKEAAELALRNGQTTLERIRKIDFLYSEDLY